MMGQIGDEQALALGHCVAALSGLESVITDRVFRLMRTDGSGWGVAARLPVSAAREAFLVLARQRTADEKLLSRAKAAMDQAASLAKHRNDLVHAFYSQGHVTTRGSPKRKRDDPGLVETRVLDLQKLNAISQKTRDLYYVLRDLAFEIDTGTSPP